MGGRRRTLRDELTDLPNLLTIGRVLVIPFVVWFIDNRSQVRSFVAMLLYLLAAFTDFLDGFLARQRGQVSILGKFLDPLADKLIVMAALVMLVHLGRVAAWVVIAVMAREFMVTGLRTIAMSEGIVIAAGQEGKYKTALQLAGISFLLLHYTYPIDAWAFSFDLDANRVGTWLLYVSVFFSVLSAVFYFRDFVRAVYRKEDGEAASAGASAGEAGHQGAPGSPPPSPQAP
jgi:CDP-diacylglycerol--glycerol-3-phosphate 3-phosphatidyltransferase